MQLDEQAEELNQIIKNNSEAAFSLLSKKGKAIYFPKKGILAQSADAKGKKINATIGIAIEDDNSPMRLRCIEKQLNISPQLSFPYAPSQGVKELRDKWKEMIYQKNPSLRGKEISIPVVSCALTHALSIIGYLFINEGDSLLISDLYWENYNLIFENDHGAELKLFSLFEKDQFNINSFEEKLNELPGDKKIVLLNFPNNPTGYTPTIREAEEIVKAIEKSAEKGNKIVVIIDDAYFGLVYEQGIIKESLFSMLADLHEKVLAIKVDGPTKEDYVWGFRVGFITYGVKKGGKEFYGALESKTAGAIRGNISSDSMLSQSLLLNAYKSADYLKEKDEKYLLLKSRYDEVKKVISNEKYRKHFRAMPFNSGYFMCLELNKKKESERVRRILLENYGTAVIVLQDLIRVAFSSTAKKNIQKLFDNIHDACNEL